MRYLLTLLLTIVAFAQPRPAPIENDSVRVVVARNTPGQKSRLHKHDVNRVMVHLSPGTMRLAYEGKPANDVKFDAGTVRWDPAGGMHTSENVGGTTYQIVEVELRKPGSLVTWPAKDPLKVAPKIYKVEFENDQVRVVRVRIPAKGAIPQHEHATKRVSVALTDAKIQLTKADGSKVDAAFTAGEPRWGMPDVHAEQSLVDHSIEMIMIDIKSK